MPAAATSGCRKARRKSSFPSCFSSSVVFDFNDSPALLSDKAPGHSPEALSWGVRRQNKMVPLLEEITADGDRHEEEDGEIKREVSPLVSSPAAANCHKEMPEKHCKEGKRCKFTGAKPLIHKVISTCSNKRSRNQHSGINHQPTTTLFSSSSHPK